ncbi:MAG: KH domain-containing protein [Methanomicrobiales archaeon]|nr:KH domain-containing protein [Methanomicrobiales archaeon]MDI6876004.1 KH domain-containing protein [Methanomicrobiales archaeon]
MTVQELKIPPDRVGALIGKNGATKRFIEEQTETTIGVDSKEGLVTVQGENIEGVIAAADVAKAIGRGFSPERAFQLLDEDMMLEVIDLSNAADSPQQLERVRGRVIGRAGRSREQIEDMTGTQISIYGKTVSIIGLPEQIRIARTAIEMLLSGVPHETVFSFLDKKRREAKQEMLEYYY